MSDHIQRCPTCGLPIVNFYSWPDGNCRSCTRGRDAGKDTLTILNEALEEAYQRVRTLEAARAKLF